MAIEIEAKIKVTQISPIEERVKACSGKLLQQVTQRDYFFDRSDRSLVQGDRGLRIRRETSAATSKTILCYKGPRSKGSTYKSRQELELEVDDFDTAQDFLLGLDFELTLAFEKKRDLWQLDDCSVCLDKVVELGSFVEVEGPNQAAVRVVLEKLELAEQSQLPDSYAVMLAKLLQEREDLDPQALFF
ncbi:MAG: class IV adenylate cyclase [Sedimentisphaerales bacterium]|nr:class IV adenylate cyclase [Sedimentisphaerales bacterium]